MPFEKEMTSTAGAPPRPTSRPAPGRAAFILFLMATVTLFLRPVELIPELAEVPIYEGLMVLSLVATLAQLRRQMSRGELVRRPVTICVVGLLVSVVLSHLTQFYFSGALNSGIDFAKTALYYLIFTALVDTPARLKTMLITVAAGGTILVALCVGDYLEIFDIPAITHYSERDGVTDTNDEHRVLRMRGTGLYSDPNDLSLMIVMTAVLLAWLAGDRGARRFRWLWLAPLGLMGLALLLTQSRGGLLAAGTAGVAFAWLRWGRTQAAVLILLGVCALPLMRGRQAQIDLSDGTGRERIELWRDGLQELKSPALLFGIGMGEFVELSGLVAHNSFVHSFVELGLCGGTMFFGMFLFSGLALWRLANRDRVQFRNEELERLHPYLSAMLAALIVALFSLSRCYVVPTYLLLAIMTSYVSLADRLSFTREPRIVWDMHRFKQLVAGSSCLLTGLFIFVRVLTG